MGRRKIEIQPITHERNRSVTFLKRKNGLFKKAYELGVLCSVDVAVVIFEQRTGHHVKLYEYCSSDIDNMVQRHIHFDGEKDSRGPGDFNNKQDDQGDDDDEGEEEEGPGNISAKIGGKMGAGNKGAGVSIGFGSGGGFGMDQQDYRSEYQRSISIQQPPLHHLQIPQTTAQGHPSSSPYSASGHQTTATLPISIERQTSSGSSSSSINHHSHQHNHHQSHHSGNGNNANKKSRIDPGMTGTYNQYTNIEESGTPISAPTGGSGPPSASYRIPAAMFTQQTSNTSANAGGGSSGTSDQMSHYVNMQQPRGQQRGSQGNVHSPYSNTGTYIQQPYANSSNQSATSPFSSLLGPGSPHHTHQPPGSAPTTGSAFDWPVHSSDHGPRSAHPSTSASSPQTHNFPARPQSQPSTQQQTGQNQSGDVTWLDFLSGTSSGVGSNAAAAAVNTGTTPTPTIAGIQQRRADDWERSSHHSSTSQHGSSGTTPPSVHQSKRPRSSSTAGGVHVKDDPEGGGGRETAFVGNAANGNVGETQDIDELSDTSGSASGERKRQRWGGLN